MHNNLAYLGTITNDLNESGSIVSNNSWTKSGDGEQRGFPKHRHDPDDQRPRHSDGSLPTITFMHLASGSDLTGLGCFLIQSSPAWPAPGWRALVLKGTRGRETA